MRAVVTGGAGFIGSTLVDRLVRRGDQVLVIDDLSTGSIDNLAAALDRGAGLAVQDICDRDGLLAAFREFAPDTVFHLAAQVDVRASGRDPVRDATVNTLGSIQVFDACAAAGVRRVVNTSTSAVYGDGAPLPTSERYEPGPVSAYALSKLAAERHAGWYRRMRGLDVVTLRYANVYGPRQDARGDGGVVGLFCTRALDGLAPVVFGDGRQTRDFVLVDDVVSANVAAATRGPVATPLNIGSGIATSVIELAGTVAAAAGIDDTRFRPGFAPARPGELLHSQLDVRLARAELDLPDPAPLAAGVAATLAWLRAEPDRRLRAADEQRVAG